MSRNKKSNTYKKVKYPNTYYTKFVKAHLVSNGFLTLCKATTVDGVEEVFVWSKKSDRDLVRNNAMPDIEVIVGKDVTMGWDYD